MQIMLSLRAKSNVFTANMYMEDQTSKLHVFYNKELRAMSQKGQPIIGNCTLKRVLKVCV